MDDLPLRKNVIQGEVEICHFSFLLNSALGHFPDFFQRTKRTVAVREITMIFLFAFSSLNVISSALLQSSKYSSGYYSFD